MRGHGWQVFGVILVVIGLSIVVGIIAAIVASGLGTVGVAVVQWVLDVLLAPFTALIGAVLYFSLRRLHGEPATAEAPIDGSTITPM